MGLEPLSPEKRRALQAEVEQIRWYHTMDLGHGLRTRGRCDPAAELPRYRLPDQLKDQTVLDVGAWDGYFSFECARRGAARVLATDSHAWGRGGWGTKQGFELARRALALPVEDLDIDVLDLDPKEIGTFDVVLFLGVLYHLRHPLLALERIAAVSRGLAIIETVVEHVHGRTPAMLFYPGRELNVDSSNWWGPNEAAVREMLKAAGFRRVDKVSQRSLPYRALRAAKVAATSGHSLRSALRQDRMTFHAWK